MKAFLEVPIFVKGFLRGSYPCLRLFQGVLSFFKSFLRGPILFKAFLRGSYPSLRLSKGVLSFFKAFLGVLSFLRVSWVPFLFYGFLRGFFTFFKALLGVPFFSLRRS